MQAWRVHRNGEPGEVMRLDEVDRPTPGDGQLLLRVLAADINFPDALLCRGQYQVRPPLPFTPGVEVCGETPDGRRVIATPALPDGGLAEYVVADEAAVLPAPDALDDAEAAALHIGYQTGWFGLHRRAHLQAGETLLVHAAAGGVGSAAVQLGKAAGATVIGVAGGRNKVRVAQELGCDHVIDRRTDDIVTAVKDLTGGRGADVVYDPVGGDAYTKSAKCVAFEGRILVIGFASGTIPAPALNHALVKNYSILGLHWGLYNQKDPAAILHCHQELTELAAKGIVKPLISERVPMADAASAVQRVADGATTGRLVVIPDLAATSGGGRPVTAPDAAELRRRTEDLLAADPPADTAPADFLKARFDAGLAWVHFPAGLGGLDAPRSLQSVVDARLAAAGAPDNDPRRIGIGLGMAAPTILAYGTDEQKRRFLRPLWVGDEVWCQLFSEPGAGSDLAALATRAVRDDNGEPGGEPSGGGDWIVNGQKVWTSSAHLARWAILIARTDPALPKHQGISYFICDMTDPGVEVRPLRQITGEAEFNEVFLTDVRIPDAHRLGPVGDGWKVARTTLMNERVSIGGARLPREGGMIGTVSRTWRERPELRTHELHQRLLALWVEAEVARLTGERLRQQLAVGRPGPEGSGLKLSFARLNQEISGLEVELLGDDGLLYDDWTMRRPELVDFTGREAGYRYLRSKGNSIEGGTSEVLLNIVAERVLGLPAEPRDDKDVAWKDLAR